MALTKGYKYLASLLAYVLVMVCSSAHEYNLLKGRELESLVYFLISILSALKAPLPTFLGPSFVY